MNLNIEQSIGQIVSLCNDRRQTLSVAESCTGGLIASQMTSHSGVSSFFLGGIVSYCNQIKSQILNVSSPLLKTHGAVSAPVAREMARGVRRIFKTHWSVSVTGIAGPSGGSKEKPVGTVWFGVCGPGIESIERKKFDGDRKEIQWAATDFALQFLISKMKGH